MLGSNFAAKLVVFIAAVTTVSLPALSQMAVPKPALAPGRILTTATATVTIGPMQSRTPLVAGVPHRYSPTCR